LIPLFASLLVRAPSLPQSASSSSSGLEPHKMAFLHQFDYVFALGMIFAFLDAWNIGANDVGM
jgi:hypothetical protein